MMLDMKNELMLGMESMMISLVRKAVMHCGEVHNFDGEEMLRVMNVGDIKIKICEKGVKEKVPKVSKEKGVKVVKEKKSIPMPFSGEELVGCCKALRQNHGLYTQCETTLKEDEMFCKKCVNGDKFGTISQRLEAGLFEFRDPKGKAPTGFVKVMKKLKLSREQVEEEAGKLNIIINDIHFQEEKKEKKEKGRPKKAKKVIVLEDESTDLFAELVKEANNVDFGSDSEEEENSNDEKTSIACSIIDTVLEKVNKTVENNEKEAAKLAEKQKKEAEKALKEAEKLAEKQKKEAEKALKEAEKLAEKQKKDAEKAEKDAEKLAEKQKKDAEKAEKEAAKLAEKEAEKKKKEAEKAEKEAAKLAEKEAKKSEKKGKKESSESETDKKKEKSKKKEEDEEEDVVKRFEFEGVKYLRSKKTGIIYNMDQDVVGKWNEKTSKIDFVEADSEEEEEEYDM